VPTQGSSSAVRHVVNGVVRWGLPTGVLVTLFQPTPTGAPGLLIRSAFNLVTFGAAGVLFGLVMWKVAEHSRPPVDPPPPSVQDATVSLEVRTGRVGAVGILLLAILGPRPCSWLGRAPCSV
jgi:hypothetical protein